jgi:hypothetical protein
MGAITFVGRELAIVRGLAPSQSQLEICQDFDICQSRRDDLSQDFYRKILYRCTLKTQCFNSLN